MPSFQRYAAFIDANPSWPHAPLFRRRAENALWNDKLDDATVRAFFAQHKPTTAKGRFVLARALLAQGDRAGAAALVREAWRYEDCSAEVEKQVLEMFGGLLTRADHKVRMEQRFYADDVEAGMRAAERLGGNDLADRARPRRGDQARPATPRRCSTRCRRRRAATPAISSRACSGCATTDKSEEAGRLILTAPQDRRRAGRSRSMVDGAAPPGAQAARRQRRADRLSGGARRGDADEGQLPRRRSTSPPAGSRCASCTIRRPPPRISPDPEGTDNPHALARGGYWQGRAAEAMGQRAQAKAFYEAAAQYTATYYGQLARARLGLPDLGLRGPPQFTPQERSVLSNLEVVRAVEILYALDERDMLASIFAELGESATDVAGMAMLGEIAGQARRRPRHAAARQGRARPRPAARLLRLSGRSACPTISRSRRRSSRRWSIRSRARRATSTRRSSRAPTPWA